MSPYPLVPIANFLGFLLATTTISASIFRSWNTGVCIFAVWVCLLCLIRGVNSIIWADNLENVAPIWCDITTHIDVGSVVALPACSFSMTRRLYKITHFREVTRSPQEKRNEVIFDLLLCLGFPLFAMSIYYIVQSHRFLISEDIGCLGSPSPSVLSLLLFDTWSILFPVISAFYYCPRILRVLYQHRGQIDELLSKSSSVSQGDYLRVLALRCLNVFLTLPTGVIQILTVALETSVVFWPGWSYVHRNWSEVPQLPSNIRTPVLWVDFEIKEWLAVVYAVVLFLLFGLTQEAKYKYKQSFWAVARPLGLKQPEERVEVSEIMFNSLSSSSTLSVPSPLRNAKDPKDRSVYEVSVDIEKGPPEIESPSKARIRAR